MLILKRKKDKNNADEFSLFGEYKATYNNEILAGLYQNYIHLVYGVCMKYLQNRELAQDAVIRIYEKISITLPYQDVVHFKSWLYVVTKNFCLMELRKKGAEEKKFQKWAIEEQQIMESGFEMHPLDNNETLSGALLQCIEKLKSLQKKCIELFYFDNKCYREIGDIAQLDEKAVKSFIQNGKRNLKICLENSHANNE